MTTNTAVISLIEIAVKASEAHAKKLGTALLTVRQAHEKMELLNQYRDDYEDRLIVAMKSGMTTLAHRNFLVFIEKLENAIESQALDIRNKQLSVERERSNWQDSERKRLSYQTLVKRSQELEFKKEAKRDQKESDEQANRIGSRRLRQ
jgi:flagellar FliJ protein